MPLEEVDLLEGGGSGQCGFPAVITDSNGDPVSHPLILYLYAR